MSTGKSHRDWLVHLFGAAGVSLETPSLETFYTPCLGAHGLLDSWILKTLHRSLLGTESPMILTVFLIFITFLPPGESKNAL